MSDDPSCREVIDVLADYLDGGLSRSDCVRLERHLAQCPACVAYLDQYRTTIRLARSVRDEPCPELPAELVRAVLAARRGG